MALVYKVIIVNRRTGASTVYQDATRHHSAPDSNPPEFAGSVIGQGTLKLVDLDQAPDLVVDDFFETWQGWWDTTADGWSEDYEIYGSFIQGHTGHFEGGVRHDFACDLADYNLLFDTTPVLTWPTDLDLGEAPLGYPAGGTVKDWLVGLSADGAPFDGIIPFHFPGDKVNLTGVDPIFDTIILDEAHMPTMSNVDSPDQFGMFGFMSLRDLLDEVLKYARLAARDDGIDIRPAYFFRAIVHQGDGTKIYPQFCLVDLNNQAGTGTVKATYSVDPGPGEYLIEAPIEHERDPRSVQIEVITMADGDRADGFVWAARHSTEGADKYPAYYQRRGYWGGPPILNADLVSQGDCEVYTQQVADTIWGPRGQLRYYARGPRKLKVGDFIQLDFPAEGQDDHIVPVLKIERDRTSNSTRMRLTVGERTVDIGDILIPRADAPMLLTPGQGGNAQGTAAGQWVGGAGASNTPRQRPIVNVATTNARNVVQGKNNATTAFIVQQNPADGPLTGGGGEAPGDPVPAVDIHIMSRLWDAIGAAWYKTCWVDKHGTPHKQKIAAGWTADGTYYFAVAERMTVRTAVQPSAQTGVTFTYTRNRAGAETTVTLPFELLVGDELYIAAAGVSGHASLTLVTGDPL